MNINAGNNSANNMRIRQMKEEKRPSFATIFDKLDARGKKLNSKNPLNAALTNDAMFRFYLTETDPLLRQDETLDLNDILGNKSINDIKLSDFAKLLSGNLGNDINTKYESLLATIYPTPPASITPASTGAPVSIAPAIAPVVATGTAVAPIASAPIASAPIASAPAAPAAVSGGTPAAAPIASAPIASAPIASGGSGTTPAAAPASTPAAVAAAPVSTPSGTSVPAAATITGGGTVAAATAISTINPQDIKDFLDVMGVDYTAPLTPRSAKMVSDLYGVDANTILFPASTPTATPTATPTGASALAAVGGIGTAAAAGGGTAAAPASTPAAGAFDGSPEGGYKDDKFIKVYNANRDLGNNPPTTTLKEFRAGNIEWIKQLKLMNEHNDKVGKDELKFPFSEKQQRIINALDYNKNEPDPNNPDPTKPDPVAFVFEEQKKNKGYFNQPLFKPGNYKSPNP